MRLAFAITVPAILAASVAAAPAGCLPGDTRPDPASLLLAVDTSAASRDGVTTADGWAVSFDRVLVGLGDASLDGSACNAYANARYDRVFSAPAEGAQKLSLVYGLGQCALRLRLRSPSSDTLLGLGVTSGDVATLRTPGTDAWYAQLAATSGGRDGPTSGLGGTALLVVGQARKGDLAKRFSWSFRGSITLRECGIATEDGGVTTALDLHGGEVLDLPITLAPEELFRLAEGSEGLLFDPFAAADADDDGAITLAELAGVAAPATADADAGPGDAGGHDEGGRKDAGAGPAGDLDGGEADAGAWTTAPGAATLGDLVYLTLATRTVRVRGAACQVDRQQRGGGPGP